MNMKKRGREKTKGTKIGIEQEIAAHQGLDEDKYSSPSIYKLYSC